MLGEFRKLLGSQLSLNIHVDLLLVRGRYSADSGEFFPPIYDPHSVGLQLADVNPFENPLNDLLLRYIVLLLHGGVVRVHDGFDLGERFEFCVVGALEATALVRLIWREALHTKFDVLALAVRKAFK